MMILTTAVSIVLLLGSCYCDDEEEALVEEFDLEVGQSVDILSLNYPDDASANLQQIWRLKTSLGSVIQLKCDDIRLFQSNPCNDYALEITDESGTLVKCGSDYKFQYVSSGETLELVLTTGQWGRGFVKCRAQAINDQEAVQTTTQKNLYSFLEDGPVDIDSSEHGGPPGRRNTSCPCGWANKDAGRIYGGRETKVNEYPFMAGLTEEGNRLMFCGAVILDPWHALTAAHCIDEGVNYSLVVGEHDTRTESETSATYTVAVREVIVHADYVPSLFHNDIALLVLRSELRFDKYVGPVCLPTGPMNVEGEYIKLIGWGKTETGKYMNPFLQKVDLRVLSKSTCYELRPSLIPPGSPKQLCAYAAKKSACSGDSGGPLVWLHPDTNRFVLVGIVSYGTTNCGSKMPRVSTDATAYLDWIRDNMKAGDRTCSVE
uniref:Venom S1 protease with CUB domain 5 n=1 Tax=Lethocerus distinctifemur TaxID=280095 RepID=A0A2K8JRA6_9HEMI|nr:venom S1 protease with CUB domain 5 [Lethocerus distinctifemur]